MDLYYKHESRLDKAVIKCLTREAWSPFVESPSRKLHPEGALQKGKEAYEALLHHSITQSYPILVQPGMSGTVGEEISPYTAENLDISYGKVNDLEALLSAQEEAMAAWQEATPRTRVGICMEILDRYAKQSFLNAFATMHTAGQTFMLAFAGSGASSLDRGLEGIAQAHIALSAVPEAATFTRSFGPHKDVTLNKRFRLRARGVAAVVTCASYPAWNAYPAIFANLCTGNAVAVKPHPGGTLPMAIAVATGREVLKEAGFDPNLLCLVADSSDAPITKDLITHDRCKIIDFTGSQTFGNWIEAHCAQKLVYTETSGTNAVVIESTHDLDGMLFAIAQSLCLFSSQMCTSAQNIWVPKEGFESNKGHVSFDDFVDQLCNAVDTIAEDPKKAAGICGALQSDAVTHNMDELAKQSADIKRKHAPYAHPEFPNARTLTPIIVTSDPSETLRQQEHFGPAGIIMRATDADQALKLASEDARECGAIASYVYSTNEDFLDAAEDIFFAAGASLGCNLVRQLPINFAAAYSDFHVTGLNPAGNACLTDAAFVSNRFRIVQSKREQPKKEISS